MIIPIHTGIAPKGEVASFRAIFVISPNTSEMLTEDNMLVSEDVIPAFSRAFCVSSGS